MTNKEIVRSILPDANVESHVTTFPKTKYYLVRNGREYMYLAEGETAAKAWANAVPIVLERAADAIRKIQELEHKK